MNKLSTMLFCSLLALSSLAVAQEDQIQSGDEAAQAAEAHGGKAGKQRRQARQGRGADGGAAEDGAPRGDAADHVMGKFGGGQNAPAGGRDRSGGRGADGGAMEDEGPQGEHAAHVMGKVDGGRKASRKSRQRDGGRGGDGGAMTDEGPQGEQAGEVMRKVGGSDAPVRRANKAGGRGADGGASEDGAAPMAGGRSFGDGDGINQGRANKGGQVEGPVDDAMAWFGKKLLPGEEKPVNSKQGQDGGIVRTPGKTPSEIEAQKKFEKEHPGWAPPPKPEEMDTSSIAQ